MYDVEPMTPEEFERAWERHLERAEAAAQTLQLEEAKEDNRAEQEPAAA